MWYTEEDLSDLVSSEPNLDVYLELIPATGMNFTFRQLA